jgi:hypothetical protein
MMSNREILDEVQAAAVEAAVPLVLATQFARIEDRFSAELEPLLGVSDLNGGYNCCGCSTYQGIYEHALRIVREEMMVDQNG